MILGIVGLAGASVGAVYSWATSVYSYNREAWMTDIQILQQHDYQYDNLQIAAHVMSRDQVRDRTEATITKLNNYILVTTLILALAAEMLVEGNIPKNTSDFVLNVYMLSLGSAILYLALGALFGVAASSIIYDGCKDLLTKKVPPPWKEIDNKMRDREDKKMTQAFERRPFRQIFMPPLFKRLKRTAANSASRSMQEGCFGGVRPPGSASGADTQSQASSESGGQFPPGGNYPRPACPPATAGKGDNAFAPEPHKHWTQPQPTVVDDHLLESIKDTYELEWAWQERGWQPLLDGSRRCVALGLHCLLESYGYLCMATLYGDYGSAWAFWAVQIIFITLNVLFVMSIFEFGHTRCAPFFVALGPAACAIAATTPYYVLDRILVPVCYLCHFVVPFCFSPMDVLPDFEKIAKKTMETKAQRCGCLELCEANYLSHLRCCPVQGAEGSELLEGLLCDTSSMAVDSDIEEAMIAREHGKAHRTGSKLKTQQSVPYILRPGDSYEGLDDASTSKDGGAARPAFDKKSTQEALAESEAARECSKVEKRLWFKVARVRQVVIWGFFVVRTLWAISVVWAFWKALTCGPNGFKNNNAVHLPFHRGPPVAFTEKLSWEWPSPFFRPHALVCPRHMVFMADEFRVFELSKGKVLPHDCEVNGTIADLAADCDHTGCWPVVLLRGSPPMLYDCKTRRKEVLLQTGDSADRFATGRRGQDELLYVAHRGADNQGRVVQYFWSNGRMGWAPEWGVVNIGPSGLDAMDVVHSRLLLFRTEDARTPGSGSSVEILSLNSGRTCGLYELPPGIVGAGCSKGDGNTVLILVRDAEGHAVNPMQAKLQADEEKACPEEASEEYSFRSQQGQLPDVSAPLGAAFTTAGSTPR